MENTLKALDTFISWYLNMLHSQLAFDMINMSQPWMYYYVLPIIVYTLFFIVKWTIIMLPLSTIFRSVFGQINLVKTVIKTASDKLKK